MKKNEDKKGKKLKSFRLTAEAIELLSRLEDEWKLESATAVIEKALISVIPQESPVPEIIAELALSDDAIKNHFVTTGNVVEKQIELAIPIRDLAPEHREHVWTCLDRGTRRARLSTITIPLDGSIWGEPEEQISKLWPVHQFEAPFYPKSSNDWKKLINLRQEKLTELTASTITGLEREAKDLIDVLEEQINENEFAKTPRQLFQDRTFWQEFSYDQVYKFSRAAFHGVDKYYSKKKAYEKGKEEIRENQKRKWILENGSEHLKSALSNNYNCNKLYIDERLDYEYPVFRIFTSSHNSYFIISDSPSPEALQQAELFGGSVADFYEDGAPDIPRRFWTGEGVVIQNWLGEYDIFYLVHNPNDPS